MKIIQNLTWEVTDSGSKTIPLSGNGQGDTVASELYVNPLANCSVTVTGYVNEDDETGVVLKCVDVANLEKKDSVSTAGNYLYLVSSYGKVDIEVTGTATVLLKWLY